MVVAMVWNREFLIKKLQVTKIHFRHFYTGTHTGSCTDYDFRTYPALCIQEESLEGGMLSEWQEGVTQSHLTNTVRVNLPWSKHENICI